MTTPQQTNSDVKMLTAKVLRQVERRLTRISRRRAKPNVKAAYREAIKTIRRVTH